MSLDRDPSVLALVILRSADGRGELTHLRQCLAVGLANTCPVELLLCADPRASACAELLRAASVEGVRSAWQFDDTGRGAASDADVCLAALEQLMVVEGEAIDESSLVLVSADDDEDIAGRLAHRTGGVPLGTCGNIFELGGDGVVASRLAFGGKVAAQIVASAGPWFASVRAAGGRLGHAAPVGGAVRDSSATAMFVTALAPQSGIATSLATTQEPTAGDVADIGRAALIVAGGRGVGEAGFEAIRSLASKLGAEWAGSLPTVDAGWVPVSRQIGQSGRHVDPEVYLAIGVSGTLQHLAGVGDRTRIVAMNKDPDADIFRFAEVGIVAPWEDVLPTLIEKAGSEAGKSN